MTNRWTPPNPEFKILEPGHLYLLPGSQKLQFIQREEGKIVVPGCQNEDVVALLIDRLNHLNAKFPCRENALAITKFQEGLHWLQERTRKRMEQGVEGKDLPHV